MDDEINLRAVKYRNSKNPRLKLLRENMTAMLSPRSMPNSDVSALGIRVSREHEEEN